MQEVWGPYPARCVRVRDGDTIIFDLDLGFGVRLPGVDWKDRTVLSCRIAGIQAPELRFPEGKVALAYAQTLVWPGLVCSVRSIGWDKYSGRYDGVVLLPDGRDFAALMLEAGQAVPYAVA